MPTLTIAAKNLATEMTNYNVEEKDLQGESAITVEHVDNDSSVREMLGQRGNFMNRISLFRTRIVIEDKVYLLAKDVRKALGCKSIEQLQVEYPEIVKHIEITRVETLRNNTD